MAITSYGYVGTIAPNDIWSEMQWALGVRYAAYNFSECAVSGVVGGSNQIEVAGGRLAGRGILDVLSAPEVLTLPTVVSGSRHYMIYARRTWGATQATSIVYADAGASLPATMPSRNTDAGTLDDQPLALVRVTAGQSVPTVVYDLRAVGAKDYFEVDPAIPSTSWIAYLAYAGYTVKVGDTTYVRTLNRDTGNAYWQADPTTYVSGPGSGNAMNTLMSSGWVGRSEFDITGRASGAVRNLRFVARRGSSDIQFQGDSGDAVGDTVIGDVTIMSIGNPEFQPPDYMVGVGMYRSSTGRTYTCGLMLSPTGVITITDGKTNTVIARQDPGNWSIRGNFTWIAEG